MRHEWQGYSTQALTSSDSYHLHPSQPRTVTIAKMFETVQFLIKGSKTKEQQLTLIGGLLGAVVVVVAAGSCS